MIAIKYLASIADKLSKETDTIPWQQGQTAQSVWDALNPQTPMPNNTICAVDFEFFDKHAALHDNCELAFFPPVTGG